MYVAILAFSHSVAPRHAPSSRGSTGQVSSFWRAWFAKKGVNCPDCHLSCSPRCCRQFGDIDRGLYESQPGSRLSRSKSAREASTFNRGGSRTEGSPEAEGRSFWQRLFSRKQDSGSSAVRHRLGVPCCIPSHPCALTAYHLCTSILQSLLSL